MDTRQHDSNENLRFLKSFPMARSPILSDQSPHNLQMSIKNLILMPLGETGK